MRASQCGHIHIFPTFMPSVFCFYFPSTCYRLSLEYTFPVMSFNLLILQRSSKISPMPLNRYYFTSLAFFTYIHPHPNLRCTIAASLFLHPQVSCSRVFRVQVPESFPLLLSPLSAATCLCFHCSHSFSPQGLHLWCSRLGLSTHQLFTQYVVNWISLEEMRKRRKGATVESWGWKAFLAVVIFVVLYKRVLSFTNSLEVKDNFIFFLILNLFAEQHAVFMLEALESLMEILTSSTPQHSFSFQYQCRDWNLLQEFFRNTLLCNPVQLGQQ